MRSPLVVTSLGIHIAIAAAFVIAGFWKLEKLDPGRRTIDLAVGPQLPAAAESGSPSAAKQEPFKKKQQKQVTKDTVQPTKPDLETKPTTTSETPGTGSGGTGSGAGSGSGTDPTGRGTCTEEPCGDNPDPVKEKKEPIVETERFVPPTVIKGLRLSGETQIHPPANVKTAIMRDGKTKVIATYRVCVAATGAISSLALIKSSGYPGYDSALDHGLRGWRYRPYEIDGKKVPVCGVVTFIYAIQ